MFIFPSNTNVLSWKLYMLLKSLNTWTRGEKSQRELLFSILWIFFYLRPVRWHCYKDRGFFKKTLSAIYLYATFIGVLQILNRYFLFSISVFKNLDIRNREDLNLKVWGIIWLLISWTTISEHELKPGNTYENKFHQVGLCYNVLPRSPGRPECACRPLT